MNIRIPSLNRNDVGGASTFNRNFKKGMSNIGIDVIENGKADILFISGASLCDRGEAEMAKNEGAKIVLRVDNILEDTKNRNTGMPRVKDFAEMADAIVYQSKWAMRLMKPYAGDGVVIENGVDTDIFYPADKNWDNIRVLYSKNSRNEVKNWHYVQYFWRDYSRPDDVLVLVGKFSQETMKANHPFEFHNNEKWEYRGLLNEKQFADVIRGCDVAYLPYSFDACSNTVLECQACGVPVIYSPTGGTPEIVTLGVADRGNDPKELVDTAMASKSEFNFENYKDFWGIGRMCEEYKKLFETLC